MDDKALLVARLALGRAALWQEMIGLDAGLLAAENICGSWVAADALAHIAAWDEIHSERIRLILAGRARNIQIGVTDAINAEIFEQRHGWSLARAVDVCNAARADFLALIAPLSWDAMQQAHPVNARTEFSIRELVERRAFHDGLHTDDLRSWRAYANPVGGAGPGVVLRAALDAAREELLAWAALIPEDERTTRAVCDGWALQDVLGHVADWERHFVSNLADAAAGRLAGAHWDGDIESWNVRHAAARRGQAWDVTWTDFHAERTALLAHLDRLGDAELAARTPSRQSEQATPYGWFTICLDHDREHAEILRESLTARR
jgi:uncharacterized damage-inducible protein DinB